MGEFPIGGTIDEAAARRRFGEIADTCGGCRRCTDRCPVFPTLFDLIEGRDAGAMTPAEQDEVVDACWQCGRCLDGCPYGPGVHEVAVDVAASVREVRSAVVRSGRVPLRDRLGDRLLGRPDLVGRLAGGAVAPLARPVLRSAAAIGRVRLDPVRRGERFTRWWGRRAVPPGPGGPSGSVDALVFPTCSVEYGASGIGRALVEGHERLVGPCRVSASGCCGAPWLHSGDLDRFRRTARRTMSRLANELGDDTVVLVPEVSCAAAMAEVAPRLIDDPAIARVAAMVRDPVTHLLGRLRVDAAPTRAMAVRVVHHVSCRSVDSGRPVVDLLGLLGAEVTVVRRCSGVGDEWGARRARGTMVDDGVASLVARLVEAAPSSDDLLTSECRHTAAAVERAIGRPVLHPLEIIERLCVDAPEFPLAERPTPF